MDEYESREVAENDIEWVEQQGGQTSQDLEETVGD